MFFVPFDFLAHPDNIVGKGYEHVRTGTGTRGKTQA